MDLQAKSNGSSGSEALEPVDLPIFERNHHFPSPYLAEDESPLLHYWRILKKRRWSVLATLSIILALTIIFTLKTIPLYQATSKVAIFPETPNVLGFKDGGNTSPDYDYGSSVVYQGDNVYMNGQDAGTTQQFAEQATTIASQGQTANAPPTDDWKPLGVFALVQGDDKTSNYIFQLAVNKNGIIRGNYYDGVMDTNTEVFGSVDKKTQRAAWTVGKKKDRVFEAGIYNLTQPECPCLLHLGTQSTTQMMLVRVQQPQSSVSQPFTVISPQ